MKFFEIPKSYLPQSFSSETQTYVRATFGLLAAVTTAINPLVGVLVLVGHGTWELAGFCAEEEQQEQHDNSSIMSGQEKQEQNVPQSMLSEQERREQNYNEAFNKLLSKAKELGTLCSPEEIDNVRRIFFVHNLIEEVCYKAFADIVEKFGIIGDAITEEQSGIILAYIKKIAHVELRKPGGYSLTGREMITPEQFSQVLAHVATIIHDRDARLTDARYYSLTDLCIALDDHNSYVKNILFRSWFKCGQMSCDSHLNMIKDIVGFNGRASAQLGFHFERSLAAKKEYYDRFHAGIRTVEHPKTHELSALKFTNLTEVRAKFTSIVGKLLESDPHTPLTTYLSDHQLLDNRDIDALTRTRCYSCVPRFHQPISQRALLEPNVTVGEFLNKYFPELEVQFVPGNILDEQVATSSSYIS